MKTKQSKKVCVVLDTNIWRKERMMRRGLGASLLHELKRMGGYIGLPDVVKKEMLI